MTPKLGILMLDTRFPRIPGDVGCAQTWAFPVAYSTVNGATPEAVVCDDPEPFVEQFIIAGQKLLAAGCTGLATTCGFLSLIRPRLATALGVPVAASSLEQVAQIAAGLPAGKTVGILTISARSLTKRHLDVASVPPDCVVQGLDGTSFATTILGNRTNLDVRAARLDMVTAAKRLAQNHPKVGAIVLECTNMPPYAADISLATGLPVHSIVSYLNWFHAGLAPSSFDAI